MPQVLMFFNHPLSDLDLVGQVHSMDNTISDSSFHLDCLTLTQDWCLAMWLYQASPSCVLFTCLAHYWGPRHRLIFKGHFGSKGQKESHHFSHQNCSPHQELPRIRHPKMDHQIPSLFSPASDEIWCPLGHPYMLISLSPLSDIMVILHYNTSLSFFPVVLQATGRVRVLLVCWVMPRTQVFNIR